jgi:hypothetical protein
MIGKTKRLRKLTVETFRERLREITGGPALIERRATGVVAACALWRLEELSFLFQVSVAYSAVCSLT